MGSGLHILGNHNYEICESNISFVSNEIVNTLNLLEIDNAIKLKEYQITWAKSSYKVDQSKLWKIETTNSWRYYAVTTWLESHFIGPSMLQFTITPEYVRFLHPPQKLFNWFKAPKSMRNEWRKYLLQLLKTLNGDRLILLADWHDFYGKKFSDLEQELLTEYGQPLTNYEFMYGNIENIGYTYFIDD